MTTALITGASGQDGTYLAEHLIDLGYEVFGMIRGVPEAHPRYDWLRTTVPDLKLIGGDLLDQGSLRDAVWETEPDEIYNLGAVSSPGQAWQQPMLTAEVTGLGVLRLLDAINHLDTWGIHLVQAGSLATHGPYGAAKTYAQAICADYRQRGLSVSVAVFGGHHSPRRAPCYFSRKVTKAVAAIAAGAPIKLQLGSLERMQDWGWASDFVTFLPEIAQLEPDDYVVSTGAPRSCLEWVEAAFKVADLDWHDHVEIDQRQGNVTDVSQISAEADERLSRRPLDDFEGMVTAMVRADMLLWGRDV